MYNKDYIDIAYGYSCDSYSLWNRVELPRHKVLTIINDMLLFQPKRTYSFDGHKNCLNYYHTMLF